MDPEQIRQVPKIGNAHLLAVGKPMIAMNTDHKSLSEKRDVVKKRFKLVLGLRSDRHIRITPLQVIADRLGNGVCDFELNVRMPFTNPHQESDKIGRGNGTHHEKF